jgi:hypothetical protein
VPIVRSADWRTSPPTSTKVGAGVRPCFGALGASRIASQTVSQPAYEQRLASIPTAQVMRHDGPTNDGPRNKVFAATQYQEDP